MAQSMADAGEFPFWGLKLVVFFEKISGKKWEDGVRKRTEI